MNEPSFQRSDCRLCLSKSLALALPMLPTPLADAFVTQDKAAEKQPLFPLDLYLCEDCGHVQLNEVVKPEVLYKNYLYETSSSAGLVKHFETFAADTARRLDVSASFKVVDIGSNDGSLALAFKNLGAKVLGVEPGERVAQKARERGIETTHDFFSLEVATQISSTFGQADLITAMNVFAHVDDLSGMAEGIARLLSSKGLFVFEVSYLPDIFRNFLFDTIYHEHLSYHSIRPLADFFKRHGLELIEVERLPTKGGSFRGTVQKQGGKWPLSAHVRGWIAGEEASGWHQVERYHAFGQEIANRGDRFREMLIPYRRIAGYGASHTTTTLLYQWDLGRHLGKLFDDNPAKQGLLSPGFHLKVDSSDEIYQEKVDAIVLLAWQFQDAIVARHTKFLNQGGVFLIPLPEPGRISGC